METKVIAVTDEDMLMVSPDWTWRGKTGFKVRPSWFYTVDRGVTRLDLSSEQARTLLIGRLVELVPIEIRDDELICHVRVDDWTFVGSP